MDKVNLINLTPHEITIFNAEGTEVVRRIEASGKVARVATAQEVASEINGIVVKRSVFGAVSDLPDSEHNTFYVVSLMVAQALPDRTDLICPDTSPAGAVRDAEGKIIGCRGFQTVSSAKTVCEQMYDALVNLANTEHKMRWQTNEFEKLPDLVWRAFDMTGHVSALLDHLMPITKSLQKTVEKYTEVVRLEDIAKVLSTKSLAKNSFSFTIEEVLMIEKMFGTQDEYAMTFLGRIVD